MSKTLTGIVTSDKTDKTIVVAIHDHKTHPLYKKQYPVSKKYMAHDAKNEAQTGDKVIIGESRPLSARKRHTLLEIIERPLIRAEQSVEQVTAVQEDKPKPKPKSKTKTKPEESK